MQIRLDCRIAAGTDCLLDHFRYIFLRHYACLSMETALSAELTGVPRVVDGDTLVLNGVKIRLEGIDAPESDQVCLDDKAQRWTCGIAARDRLDQKIGSNSITCSTTGRDNTPAVRFGTVTFGSPLGRRIIC